jgi:hypothetical protein
VFSIYKSYVQSWVPPLLPPPPPKKGYFKLLTQFLYCLHIYSDFFFNFISYWVSFDNLCLSRNVSFKWFNLIKLFVVYICNANKVDGNVFSFVNSHPLSPLHFLPNPLSMTGDWTQSLVLGKHSATWALPQPFLFVLFLRQNKVRISLTVPWLTLNSQSSCLCLLSSLSLSLFFPSRKVEGKERSLFMGWLICRYFYLYQRPNHEPGVKWSCFL